MHFTLIVLLAAYLFALASWVGHEVYLTRCVVRLSRESRSPQALKKSAEFTASSPRLSVVVCIRNGQDQLLDLFKALEQQKLEGDWEVIMVDDDSSDSTWRLLADFQRKTSLPFALKTFQVKNTTAGKKQALQYAIDQATGSALVFTDVDCVPASSVWLQRMVEPLEQGQDLVLGVSLPLLGRTKGLVGALQAWDALRIVRSYVGWALHGRPYMGVGRNMAMRAEIHPGFEANADLASGDDDLTIQQLLAFGGVSTVSLIHRESQVDSELPKTAKSWFRQKQRHWTTAPRYTTGDRLRLIFPQVLTLLSLVFGVMALVSGFHNGVLHIVLWIVGVGMGSAWLVAGLTFRSIAKACQTPDRWFHYGWLQPLGTCWMWMIAIMMAVAPSKRQW
jgi:cellulose synthase/poly-beta-1,6-N-acetylglucosamine synthase-like glycosyltransferase